MQAAKSDRDRESSTLVPPVHAMVLSIYVPFDQMHPASRIHNPTHLPWLQRECGVLEFLLHVAGFEEAPINSVVCR